MHVLEDTPVDRTDARKDAVQAHAVGGSNDPGKANRHANDGRDVPDEIRLRGTLPVFPRVRGSGRTITMHQGTRVRSYRIF